MEKTEAMPNGFEIDAGEQKASEWVCPEFKVSGVFSSGMVLQRDREIKVWGFSQKLGGTVTGEFDGETSEANVGDDNVFTLKFKKRKYSSAPKKMIIHDDCGHEAVFDDILIGDVWMIGGQSNSELPLKPCIEYSKDVSVDEKANFRLFAQFQHDIELHQEYCNAPQRDVLMPEWRWKRPCEEASLEFSAMGWFFADRITRKTDVPLGMIMIGPAGACISELMPTELANECGYFKKTNVVVGGYYNTAINPFVGLQFKGMLFFQGESESIFDDRCVKYAKELMLFLEDERKRFGFDFPFYNVQLSNYTKEGVDCFRHVDYIRLQQYEAYKRMENTELEVDMDLGAPEGYADWPHSPYKETLGERLANLALAKEYGIGDVSYVRSPEPEKATVSEDKKSVCVRFANVGDGLRTTGTDKTVIGSKVNGFGFGLWDRKTDAQAKLTGKDEVTVYIPVNADISVLTYAYDNLADSRNANLYSSTGIPTMSFDIEL